MDMKNEEIYDYLHEKWVNYILSHDTEEKENIEDCVRSFIENNVSGSLYREFDVNNTGDTLFKHGFFEVDLERALTVLENKLNTDNN